jgi:acyl dehydratase
LMNASLPLYPSSISDLHALIGQEIGPTEWFEVTQAGINAFADATGDHQWIHVDPERAAASPLGTTIAHGLYSLSLGPGFSGQLISFEKFTHSLNYGYDKVRFIAPVPVGSRLRMRMTVTSAEQVPGGIQLHLKQTFERDGSDKPVAVAEALARLVDQAPS